MESILRRQMVGGVVLAASPAASDASGSGRGAPGGFSGFVPAAARAQPQAAAPQQKDAEATWLQVTLSRGEWERLAKDQPVRILPLVTRAGAGKELLAQPAGMPPVEDVKRSMLTAYYKVPVKDHGIAPHTRVRVELPITGSDEKRTVIPYSAVYYDAKGATWAYVNPEPLVFVRQRIAVERIAGDFAVLTDSPPVGTAVVTVGAPLLYGVEIFKK